MSDSPASDSHLPGTSSSSVPQPTSHPAITKAESVAHLQELVHNNDSVLVVGNRTKPALSTVAEETVIVTTNQLTGITQYEPSEFTFTARAGTTIGEINAALLDQNQYLPFDPFLAGENATLAGTLAAGLSGPGRHRFGGIRDFVLGTEFVAGDGALIRAGGKVVKNAAGFDIPKLLVGSCGRLGAITSLTFKVFPRPCEFHTYSLTCHDHHQATKLIALLARGRWELDAIDYRAQTRCIWIRLGGPQGVCDAIVADVRQEIAKGLSEPLEFIAAPEQQASEFWSELNSLRFGGAVRRSIIKVPMTLDQLTELAAWCDTQPDQVCLHNSVAGAIGWLACDAKVVDEIDRLLASHQLSGLIVSSDAEEFDRFLIGTDVSGNIRSAVKLAMDPPGRFPEYSG